MARKKTPPEHVNHERWLVSYADFITLLFAFFVVMYSVSSVNEGKFRVLSGSLVASFHTPNKSSSPIQVGQVTRSYHQLPTNIQAIPFKTSASPIQLDKLHSMSGRAIDVSDNSKGIDGGGGSLSSTEMDIISDNLEEILDPLIDKDLIKLRKNADWVEIEINNSVLFTSGSSDLAPDAAPVLQAVASILKTLPNRINVEGFTDNLPIKNLIYPSNWELSASRAATVVRLFASYGVDPSHLASIGYGEFKPVSDNTTPEGRARNRRIAVIVLATNRKKDNKPEHTFGLSDRAMKPNNTLLESPTQLAATFRNPSISTGKP